MDRDLPPLPHERRHWSSRSHDHDTEFPDDDRGDGGDLAAFSHRTISSTSRSPSPDFRQTAQHLMSHKTTINDAKVPSHNAVGSALPVRRRAHLLRNWWLELGACFVFILALIAIVVTLRPHQGKPLPQWPYNISVNSLIAIYVVILKATVLLVTAEGLGQLKWRWFRSGRSLQDIVTYDKASRGALGSLSLLWSLGLRHPLSSCGAVITILVLAIDPFAQQIIRYYGCSIPVSNMNATIPRTNLYESGGTHVGAGLINVDSQLQSAINAGIFSPGSLVTPSCSTGNCSFSQPYDTLGYCGGCTDITADVKIISHNTTGPTEGTLVGTSYLSYLPSGTSMNSTPYSDPDVVGQLMNFAVMNHTYDQSDTDVAEILVGKNPEVPPEQGPLCKPGNTSWSCLGYGAASCTLNPCVRTYSGSIQSGDFQEIGVSQSETTIWGQHEVEETYDGSNSMAAPHGTPSMDTSGGYYMATVDTQCISADDKRQLVAAGYKIDANSRFLPYNITFNPLVKGNSTFPSSMLDQGCMYVLDLFTVRSIWTEYLEYFFNGTLNGRVQENSQVNFYDGPQCLQTMYNHSIITFESVNSYFQNVSSSMTTYMRQAGNRNHSDPATGIVMHDNTCLEVRWAWLALPAVLVLLTIVFFTAMVIETRPTGQRAQIWKSSPLALIFHGLEEPNRLHENLALEEISDMERTAKGINVRLASSAKGVNLVAAGDKGGKEQW